MRTFVMGMVDSMKVDGAKRAQHLMHVTLNYLCIRSENDVSAQYRYLADAMADSRV